MIETSININQALINKISEDIISKIKEDKKRASGILHCAITSIDACATMFTPFMPTTSKIVSDAIQKENQNNWGINEIKKGAPLKNIGHLFKKFD